MSAKKEAASSEPGALTEDDVAQVTETLEALALIGKAPAQIASELRGTSSSSSSSSSTAAPSAGGAAGGAGAPPANNADLLRALLAGRAAAASGGGAAAGKEKEHRFWSTQPVLKLDEKADEHGPIDAIKTVAEVKQEPYGLPAGFEWCTIDVTNDAQRLELYELLRDNYVEDDDCMFRFNYSEAFLLWALTPPHYFPDWIVGVRASTNKKLVASITGVPATMAAYHNSMTMCEINFLCVHKKLRTKRLAPVLIKEVTRRVNLCNIWQATYTAGVVLPKPLAQCQYWHRSINPKKLVEVQFSRLAPRMTMARTQRLYALPETPTIAGVRPATAADVPAVTKLLNAYLKRFPLHPGFTEEEVHHWLLPREGVIDSYVVDTAHALAAPAGGDLLLDDEDEEAAAAASSKKKGGKGGKKGGAAASAPAAEAPSATAAASSSSSAAPAVHPVSGSTVTDFISFYHLPSTIIGHEKHKVLSAVYSYYNVPGAALVEGSSASAGSAHGHSLETLFTQAMILGKQKGVDVFNALDLMDNTPELMKELKFAPGDGKLNYYLYNWKCPDCTPRDIGLVLL